MAIFLLIRHGSNDSIGHWIAGRSPGVGLNAAGIAEARELTRRLEGVPIAAIYSSPLDRARETAIPLSTERNLPVQMREAFNEIDYGEWTGLAFDKLHSISLWREFNHARSRVRIPGGESMLDVAHRFIAGISDLERHHGEECVAVFSHGDPIRAGLAHYAGIHLDLLQRLEVAPASVSVVELKDATPRLLKLNAGGALRDCAAITAIQTRGAGAPEHASQGHV